MLVYDKVFNLIVALTTQEETVYAGIDACGRPLGGLPHMYFSL